MKGSRLNVFRRMPLRLVNDCWQHLNQPAKAILPVIMVHINRHSREAFLSVNTIARESGYNRLASVREGIKDLMKHGLISRELRNGNKGKFYAYKLEGKSLYKRGSSYLPIYQASITDLTWALLTPSEKALYIVLGVKGTINDPDKSEDTHSRGSLKPTLYTKLSGISKQSYYNAIWTLEQKELIEVNECNEYEISIF